ncbi:DUF3667 domain-containing protein [Alteromonas sediminis]|uniref:DUF3667 domain-containing protein n=1 Tax=Alteromonas sediminis TaxID=2259342 RepID=A0A3N5Y1Y8_9ALTE|nr:DUF3667 domain-containing protein [Alteromonas sediminis]RPJ66626.1 DUF3667 domain-containing protein [Alteromonas sediminis]
MKEITKQQCKNCGESLIGPYCSACGEKVLNDKDKTLLAFCGMVFEELTSVDSRFWHTVRTLLTTPGQISHDQMIGKRMSYMRPITLFFVINVIYFLFPLFEAFNTSLQTQLQLPYAEWISMQERIDEKSLTMHVSNEVFNMKFDQSSNANSKLMIILMVPLLAPFFALVGIHRRHGMLHHVNLSLEYTLFTLLVNTVILGYVIHGIAWGINKLGFSAAFINEVTISAVAAVIAFLFLLLATRRFYHFGLWRAAICSLFLVAATSFTLFLYRLILFEVTMLSI